MRPIQHADYEQNSGGVLRQHMWLEIDTDAGVGRGKFSGVMTRELGQLIYLASFRSFAHPEPVRLTIELENGRAHQLETARVVDGQLRKTKRGTRYTRMPEVGEYIAFSSTGSDRSDVFGRVPDTDPEHWTVAVVLWRGVGIRLSQLTANMLVRDMGAYGASTVSREGLEQLIHLRNVRISAKTVDEVRDARDRFVLRTKEASEAFWRARQALYAVLEPLMKEAKPT